MKCAMVVLGSLAMASAFVPAAPKMSRSKYTQTGRVRPGGRGREGREGVVCVGGGRGRRRRRWIEWDTRRRDGRCLA